MSVNSNAEDELSYLDALFALPEVLPSALDALTVPLLENYELYLSFTIHSCLILTTGYTRTKTTPFW